MEIMLNLLLLIPYFLVTLTIAANSTIGLPGCPTTCGNITVPYPFGIKPGCYRVGFNLTCDRTQNPPKLLLGDGTLQVISISLPENIVRVKSKVLVVQGKQSGNMTVGILENGPYSVSQNRTRLTAIGCNIVAKTRNLYNGTYMYNNSCPSLCNGSIIVDNLCSGNGDGCCQTTVTPTKGYQEINVMPIDGVNNERGLFSNKVFLVEQEWFKGNISVLQDKLSPSINVPLKDIDSMAIPFVLDWSLGMDESVFSSCDYHKKNDSAYGCCSANSQCYTDNDNFWGYRCNCTHGFQGNPYMVNGCQDINECELPDVYPCDGKCINEVGSHRCTCQNANHIVCIVNSINKRQRNTIMIIGLVTGLVFLISVHCVIVLIKRIKVRRLKMTRERWFKQNHGLLLQQLVSSNNYLGERMKIFSLEELEKATNKFEATHVVGRGGHGVVYEGILSDQRVVAIKKSQIEVQREIDQFINEVVILSQIDHRNVVKLYGCCLESEVPLLVYEFISNGTLCDHLHVEGYNLLSWEDRFRIAVEIARALAHLHSTASISIFHRDVKSSNILLDDYLTAKVSDFGASRLIQIDHTGTTTAVQGTFGYLDPEYFYTCRLTEKSDVYSFGVILAELLTGEQPISSSRFQEGENLVNYFCSAMREGSLNEILDTEITGEENRAEIEAVALLVETCLRMKGEERPTMKEIETRLQVLNGSKKRDLHLHPQREERLNERENVLNQLDGVNNSRQYSLEFELVSSSHFPR